MTDRLTPAHEAQILRLVAPYLANDMGNLAIKEAARREREWPKQVQGWRTMHSAPKDGSWFQGLTTHDNVVACQFIAEDTEEGDTHGSNEFGLPGGVRFMLKAWQPLARPSQEAARREAEAPVVTGLDLSHSGDATAWMYLNAPPPSAPFVTDHKWLDPECHASGCQTLILKAELEKLKDQRDKYMWQVRDTCRRAEAAEAEAKKSRNEAIKATSCAFHDAELRVAAEAERDALLKRIKTLDQVRALWDECHEKTGRHPSGPLVALEERAEAAEAEAKGLREAGKRLADAADDVGVHHFDTDTMRPEVAEMQAATQAMRAALAGGNDDQGK